MPSSEIAPRWSADSAPTSAASCAPPESSIWSACRRAARPSSLRAHQQPARVVDLEHAALAEDVADVRDALLGDARQLLVDDAVEVGRGGVRPVAELGRDGVRAEERRHDLDRAFGAQPCRRAPAGAAPSAVSSP